MADYSEVSELQRFPHPGIPTAGRVAAPNPSIEITNAPLRSEEVIMGIIGKDCHIINSQLSPEALYFQLASAEEATSIIAKFNNNKILNAW